MIVFIILLVACCLLGLVLGSALWFGDLLDQHWGSWTLSKRIGVVSLTALMITSPYLAFKGMEFRHVLGRVPAPLQVSWIDYRIEEASSYLGLPGDNETGFVVYALTGASARWALERGAGLIDDLQRDNGQWRQTPITYSVGDNERWQHRGRHEYCPGREGQREPLVRVNSNDGGPRHAPALCQYLGRYGLIVPLDPVYSEQFDRAARRPGSFYSYGQGGSVTLVDPLGGKLFFAYSG